MPPNDEGGGHGVGGHHGPTTAHSTTDPICGSAPIESTDRPDARRTGHDVMRRRERNEPPQTYQCADQRHALYDEPEAPHMRRHARVDFVFEYGGHLLFFGDLDL